LEVLFIKTKTISFVYADPEAGGTYAPDALGFGLLSPRFLYAPVDFPVIGCTSSCVSPMNLAMNQKNATLHPTINTARLYPEAPPAMDTTLTIINR
jgi:hypothetical protein